MPRAGIYCRISIAALGDTTKTTDQERLCRELCERRGWDVAAVFTDNSRSAWKRDRRRPGWEEMLAWFRDDRLDVLVSYWGDRIVRQPRDLEDLLDLRDARPGLAFASVAGQYDFDNPDHRMMMRWEVARACNESDTISRRRRANLAAKAKDGVAPAAGGRYGRGFGYDSSGRVPVAAEADALREAAARVIGGEPLAVVARDLSARGLRSTSGEPLTGRLLKSLLLRPRIAGLMPDGSPGSWPAIIAPAQQAIIAGVLRARSAGPAWSNAGAYLLSGIARCWACGSGLQRQSAGRTGRLYMGYGCVAPGCRRVHRDMAMLDAYVTGWVLYRLGHEGNPAGEAPEPGTATEIALLLEQRTEAQAAIADPALGALRPLLTRLEAIERRIGVLREQAADGEAARLRARHAGLTAEGFAALPLPARRALVAACYRVTVLPASRRGPGFSGADIRLDPL